MGTTMTVALVENGGVTFGHVGDSRAYVLRDGELEQLTDDHSLVAELVRSGKLSAEEAEHHPQRSVITRALGTDPDVDVDTFTVEGHEGDVFVLCSDGLTDMIADDEIGDGALGAARRASTTPRTSSSAARTRPAARTTSRSSRSSSPTRPRSRTSGRSSTPSSTPWPRPPWSSPSRQGRSGWRRFLPLTILIVAILVAAAVLWVLVQR